MPPMVKSGGGVVWVNRTGDVDRDGCVDLGAGPSPLLYLSARHQTSRS